MRVCVYVYVFVSGWVGGCECSCVGAGLFKCVVKCVCVCVCVCECILCECILCESVGVSLWGCVCGGSCVCCGVWVCVHVCVRRVWFCKVRRSRSSATESVMSLKHNLHKRLSPQSLLGSGSPYLMKVGWGNRNIFRTKICMYV